MRTKMVCQNQKLDREPSPEKNPVEGCRIDDGSALHMLNRGRPMATELADLPEMAAAYDDRKSTGKWGLDML